MYDNSWQEDPDSFFKPLEVSRKKPFVGKRIKIPRLPQAYKKYSIYNYIYVLVSPERYPHWNSAVARRVFERKIFPARRTLTSNYSRLIRAGCLVLWMYWKPEGWNDLVLSVGPLEALALELKGYPLYKTASIVFQKPKGTEYSPTQSDWGYLLKHISLSTRGRRLNSF